MDEERKQKLIEAIRDARAVLDEAWPEDDNIMRPSEMRIADAHIRASLLHMLIAEALPRPDWAEKLLAMAEPHLEKLMGAGKPICMECATRDLQCSECGKEIKIPPPINPAPHSLLGSLDPRGLGL
ncbi:MAG: hypothetical protein L0177_12040 [Chloroflexi bacterium]|nr:hypothetical protein [Chloroflexota bacterium]